MGSLTSPLVLNLGSTPGEASGPGIPQVNAELFGANVAANWTFVGAGGLTPFIPWENGFITATANALAATDYAFGSTCALYTTVSVPAAATDRINCISAYVMPRIVGTISPQCRLEFRITGGPVLSIDVDPRTGLLKAKTAGVLNPQVQRLVLPLYANLENVSVYRISFAFDSLGIATGIPRFYPRTDGVAAGAVVFGGTQLEYMVSTPSAFIAPSVAVAGIRLRGQTARQTTTPNLQQKVLGAGLSPYAVDVAADQDTWLQCDLLAGNTVNLPQAVAHTFDMPTGSRLLVTQSSTAVGGVTTITGAVNSILAPGGPTSPNTTVTFPSADYPNVTQMMLIKTDVLNQWQIVSTSAGGSAGGLFLQAGAGAVLRTFQNKDRDIVSVKDFGAVGNGIADDTVAIQAAVTTGKNVFFPDGTYAITASINLANSNQSLFGSGYNSIITTLLTSNGFVWFDTTAGLNYNVEVYQLHFAGNGANRAAAGRNGNDYFISGRNVVRLHVHSNIFEDSLSPTNAGKAIWIWNNATDAKIENNFFANNQGQDVNFYGTNGSVYRGIATGNIHLDTQGECYEIEGRNAGVIAGSEVYDISIIGNIIYSDIVNIALAGSTGVLCIGARNAKIIGNTIKHRGENGIKIIGSQNVTVEGNTLLDLSLATKNGIMLTVDTFAASGSNYDVTICGNILNNGIANAAIFVHNGAGEAASTAARITISDNIIANSLIGFALGYVSNLTLSDNSIDYATVGTTSVIGTGVDFTLGKYDNIDTTGIVSIPYVRKYAVNMTASGNITFDVTNGATDFFIDVTGNITGISHVGTPKNGMHVTFQFVQTAAFTLPAAAAWVNMKFAGGVAPVLSATIGNSASITFEWTQAAVWNEINRAVNVG